MEAKKPDNEDEDDNENDNDIKKKKSKRKTFTPPTLDEIEKYVLDKKLKVNAEKFYNYFTEGNWIDKNGIKVKNWKQKLLTWDGYQDTGQKQDTTNRKIEQREYSEDDFSKLYVNRKE